MPRCMVPVDPCSTPKLLWNSAAAACAFARGRATCSDVDVRGRTRIHGVVAVFSNTLKRKNTACRHVDIAQPTRIVVNLGLTFIDR
jgi:hypothetical protein